ncbi:ABC transporter permease [Capnocytophaga canimorsus]|uniref:ABC transporter permease n=1 Tax=Capnocytophaga canimorsus TaxID=28188 RepID=UPI000D6E905A|nr:ABC transporter permease [Capnocytophaga canimorsus]AWL77500.1 ABC transporter permease [Capnocytophaga canimorsus]AYW36053.1 ABC transporter permease [Capnocytophaga canimorsus]MDT9498494.1 ABC transporter permease [Capnocytophaga canimorsus]
MKNLKLILKREYLNKIRNKSFIIMTFVSPIIMILFGLLIGYLTNVNNSGKTKKIMVLDRSSYFSQTFKNSSDIEYQYLADKNTDQAKALVQQENAYGLLYIPDTKDSLWQSNIEFFSNDSPNFSLIRDITEDIENQIFQINLTQKGIDNAQIESAKVRIDILLANFSGEKTTELSSFINLFFGGVAGYLLFMFIIIYGNMIMRSVIEEKNNRIIEIIISSVKPFQLMMGKILGTSLVGVTQFLIWMIFGGLLMTILTSFFNVSPSSTNEILMAKSGTDRLISEILVEFFKFPFMNMFVSFLLYFSGGFLLYSALYAAVGAAVDNETDTQQFMFPILLPLILAIYVGIFTVIEEPHGTISVIFSYIPFTSPVVMLMRIPFGVSWWEILISLLTLYATFLIIIGIASKIYRIGILMYGKKASYKEIWKWLKY